MEVATKLNRAIVWLLLVASICLAGCVKQRESKARALVEVKDPARRDGFEVIVILMPRQKQMKEVWEPLVSELSPEFDIVTVPIDAATSPASIRAELDRLRPACIVAMDNRTLRLYRALQKSLPDRQFPPAVILMTSFLDQVIGTLRDATGVAYEVPVVTSFVSVREIAKTPVRKIGVVYRDVFADVVKTQAELAAVEKFTVVGLEVDSSPSVNEIDDALYSLIHDQKVDALWVLNDNALLTRDAITDSWLPRLHDSPLPVVVGVSALVHPEVHFGTVAVLPDHEQLGIQAANMVFDLADNGWHMDKASVELPLSVRTVVDVGLVREYFGLQPGALKRVDEVLE